jgi:hypothetical protein
MADGSGDALGGLAGDGVLLAEQAGDGAGGLQGEAAEAVQLLGGDVAAVRIGAEVGHDPAEQSAGAGNLAGEVEVVAEDAAAGDLGLGRGEGTRAVAAAALVAGCGAGVGGTAGRVGVVDGPGTAGCTGAGDSGAVGLGGQGLLLVTAEAERASCCWSRRAG